MASGGKRSWVQSYCFWFSFCTLYVPKFCHWVGNLFRSISLLLWWEHPAQQEGKAATFLPPLHAFTFPLWMHLIPLPFVNLVLPFLYCNIPNTLWPRTVALDVSSVWNVLAVTIYMAVTSPSWGVYLNTTFAERPSLTTYFKLHHPNLTPTLPICCFIFLGSTYCNPIDCLYYLSSLLSACLHWNINSLSAKIFVYFVYCYVVIT